MSILDFAGFRIGRMVSLIKGTVDFALDVY